jgi:hypothetical protein
MSFSDASDAEPRSQILRTVWFSFTWHQSAFGLKLLATGTDQNIVRFEICVQYVAFPEQRQSEEHLMGIRTDSWETDTDIADPRFLENISEIHTVIAS